LLALRIAKNLLESSVPHPQPHFDSPSLTQAFWKQTEANADRAQALADACGLDRLTAHCLVARGVETPEAAHAFLHPSLSHIPDPTGIRNAPEALHVVSEALARREKIRIVGDYDCDGTTGLITLLNVFRLMSPDADEFLSFHVPDRERDGYGLNPGIVERAAEDGVQVLVSVDIGITAHAEWTMARERGIAGICIDHHTVLGSRAPENALVVCPKQLGCSYPEKDMAACGIALQFGRALLAERANHARIIESLTKMTAIGTVADLVPLSSPANRAIVTAGLKGLSGASPNHGLNALLEVSDLKGKAVSASDLGFRLGPRINAAGRIDGTTLSVINLFDAQTPLDARRQAERIDAWNRDRQEIQQNLVDRLTTEIDERLKDDLVYVLAGEHDAGWHQGVVGIAASKIVEHYHRPALVCSIRGKTAHGSARSIPKFNMIDALHALGDGLFTRYGGHAAAAGFALSADRLPELRERINDYARARLNRNDLLPVRRYDGVLRIRDATVSLIESLRRLGPHGIGNPQPRFVVGGTVAETRTLKERHLKIILTDGNLRLEALWWGRADLAQELAPGQKVYLLGKLDINEWNGARQAQLVADDARLHF
jgi:single-stranded-DNA-specific exonuclease